jgi:hypothetical protein
MKTRSWKILCLFFVLLCVWSPVSLVRASSTLAPSSTVSVPVPATMAYDSGKGEIFGQYNSISGSGIVEVISDSTNKVVANITEGTAAGYIGDVVYDSGKGLIFAAYGNGKASGQGATPLISVISDSNNTLVTTISWNTPGNSQYNWPMQPTGMVYDSGKGEIFVSDLSDGGVFVINDSSYAIVATIGVETSAGKMAYDPALGEVFVANHNQVSVISDSTNKVVANISVSATSLVYDPKGEVFAYNGNAISVISDSTNQVLTTITGITGGSTSIAYDSTKGEIFAGAVVSDNTNTVVAQLPAGIGNIIYDSGRGEIIGTTSTGLDLFSDSSMVTTSTTTTTTSSSSSTTSATTTSATQQTTTSTSKSGNGGVPEFPYQFMAASAFALLLAISYLVVRTRMAPKARLGAGRAA